MPEAQQQTSDREAIEESHHSVGKVSKGIVLKKPTRKTSDDEEHHPDKHHRVAIFSILKAH
jgi:hypothetical protein